MYQPSLTLPDTTPKSVTVTLREDGTAVVTGKSSTLVLTTAYGIARLTLANGTADDVDTGWGADTAAGYTVYVTPSA